MMYGWWDSSSTPWYGMIFGPLMMLTFIVLTVLIVVWFSRAFGLGAQYMARDKSAVDILKDRFARGEIDHTEYEQRKRLLSNQ